MNGQNVLERREVLFNDGEKAVYTGNGCAIMLIEKRCHIRITYAEVMGSYGLYLSFPAEISVWPRL